MSVGAFTPREIVGELDRYIVGQHRAKRAVAIALRNRWRRQQLATDLRDEIIPKNIILIGPTGVGKTEIARRLAKLAKAPFLKVEASKFTEVGYVGRDVESIVRDLVEVGLQLVRAEALEKVETRAREAVDDRLVELLARKSSAEPAEPRAVSPAGMPVLGPMLLQPFGAGAPPVTAARPPVDPATAERLRGRLRAGELEGEWVELDVLEQQNPFVTLFGAFGQEELQVKDMLSQLPGFRGKSTRRRMTVADARKVLGAEEAQKLVDQDAVQREAIARTEQSGIVFLDEIDKVAGRQAAQSGPDVSREGVQRDLLPIVEGSTVTTKYGPVRTDHVLFIAAGAFHVAKVSDLIPELQGRFPIRVELEPLGRAELVRILTEPRTALTRQYEALLGTEGVRLRFTPGAVEAIASYAEEANRQGENIGARRLHTVMEALLEDLSFSASERGEIDVVLDTDDVTRALEPILGSGDLARYIL